MSDPNTLADRSAHPLSAEEPHLGSTWDPPTATPGPRSLVHYLSLDIALATRSQADFADALA
ncbi:MAG: hypothetical protein ACK5T6_06515, partial [Pirellula sp.]